MMLQQLLPSPRPFHRVISTPRPVSDMQFELNPTVTLASNTFNVLVAPPPMLIDDINHHPHLQRYRILYVPGNYSRILSSLNRMTELDVRRAFTAFQLMTILEENHHTLVLIEHDPLLYEDHADLLDYVSMAMRQAACQATVMLYAPGMDPSLEEIASRADRVFCFQPVAVMPARKVGRGRQKGMPEDQTTLEAF